MILKPLENESQDQFIERIMKNENMRAQYSDGSQLYNIANLLWKKRLLLSENVNRIMLASSNFAPFEKEDGTIHFAAASVNEYKYSDGYNRAFKFEIQDIIAMVDNINNKITGKPSIAYITVEPDGQNPHSGKQIEVALFEEAYIKDDNAIIKLKPLNEESRDLLLSGMYQYGSPDIDINYIRKTDGKQFDYVITGYNITNKPYQHGLIPAYKLSDNDADEINKILILQKEVKMDTIKELVGELKKLQLSDESNNVVNFAITKIMDLEKQNLQLAETSKVIEAEKLALSEKVIALETEKTEADKKLKLAEQSKVIEDCKAKHKMLADEYSSAKAQIEKGLCLSDEVLKLYVDRKENLFNGLFRQVATGDTADLRLSEQKESFVSKAKKLNPEKFNK
jgi:hypothetical protein